MKKYGLLGEKLGHSFSKIIHNIIYKENGIDASYDLIEVQKEQLESCINDLKTGKYSGYNVTIPYKIEIMKYLDEISSEALEIGSVNTISVVDGKTIGYNTDYYGFLETLVVNGIDVEGKDCYILGTGGASKACKAAILKAKGNPIYVSRDKTGKKNTIDYNDLKGLELIDVLVNTTPIGMYPNVDQMPIDMDTAKKVQQCVDIIFNPLETKLLKNVKNGVNGLLMLVGQAIKAEEIWNKDIQNVKSVDLLDKVVKAIYE